MIPKYRPLLVLLAVLVAAACGDDDPVTPSATIGVSPATVSFSGTQGEANPAAQTVAVTNTGGGTLSGLSATTTYTAGQPTGWLNASLSSTTAPATLTLTPTTGTLAPGTYTATVNLASAGATNSPRAVSVTFTVEGAAGHLFSFTPPNGAPAVTSVSVRGEFNDWGETPMTLSNGTWSVRVDLEPGTYQYKFYINETWPQHMCNDETWGDPANNFWIDPNATGCNEDGFGGANAFIEIS